MSKSIRLITFSVFALVLPMLFISQTAFAYVIRVLDVQSLAKESPVIVKARVLEVYRTGTMKNDSMTLDMAASVQVDSVLKGNVEAKVITVEFSVVRSEHHMPAWPVGPQLQKNEYGLLFLTSRKDGKFIFADYQYGMIPVTNQSVPLVEAAKTTEDKIEAVLFASLSDPNRDVVRTALEQIATLKKVQSTEAIHKIAASSDPVFQGLAYSTLITLGDYSLLNEAIKFAEPSTQDIEVQRRQAGVAHAISNIRNKSVLPELHSLLYSPNLELRRSAALAQTMPGMIDPSNASFLMHALDDSDHEVQYNAMAGLAELEHFPKDAPVPDTNTFNRNPTKYLDNWKHWWETTGKQKYESIH